MVKIWLLTIVGLLWVNDQPKLVKTRITENITVSLPKDMFPMSDSDLALRFPSVRRPMAAYTNMERIVDFSVKISATQWRESDIDMAQGFFKASLFNLFDRVDLIKEGIEEINGNKFIVFEFNSRINGDQYSLDKKDPISSYNYVQYLISNGKTMVFSFTCPSHLKEYWQPTAGEVMSSVKVK